MKDRIGFRVLFASSMQRLRADPPSASEKLVPHIGEVVRVPKPWGHEVIWAHTDRYVGKILHIKKGESLSYQYHRIKEETIYLLSGSMELKVGAGNGEATHILAPGTTFHIPPGLRHRMHALKDSQVLEVSTPELDDIVRIEDRYGRV